VLGIAVIPISGTLVQKLGSLRPYSGMTGYDGIRQAFLTAMEDQDVSGICLDIDSPGGEVAGCFDLVDVIYSSREKAYSCHSDRKRLFRRLRYRQRS
jgi:ClpP class serine protease